MSGVKGSNYEHSFPLVTSLSQRTLTVPEFLLCHNFSMGAIKLGKYLHYKGKEYEVIGIARHSETLEELAVYRALYGEGQFWTRPLGMFLEEVEIDSKKIPRFEYVGE